VAPNGLLCADVPFRNYPLTHSLISTISLQAHSAYSELGLGAALATASGKP